MELVYLWVKEYKNIKRQGFSFSPKYECRYDEEKKHLEIQPKEHLENFFGNNINITAIIGENGSGKSNLLDLILDIDGWATTPNKVFYLTLKNEKLFLHLVNFTNKLTCNCTLEQSLVNRTTTGKANYSLSNMGLNCAYLSLSPFINKVGNFYSNSSLDFLSIYNYKENHENSSFNFNDFFFSLIPSIPKLLANNLINSFFNIQGKPGHLVFKFNKYIEYLFPDDVKSILGSSVEKHRSKDAYLYTIDVKNSLIIDLLHELYKKIEEKKQNLSKQIDELNNTEDKKSIPNLMKKEVIEKLNLMTDLHNNQKKEKLSDLKLELNNIGAIELYFSDVTSSNEFYFSTGELALLYYIKKLQELNESNKDTILLIDECELYLHPEWQKKFIKFLSELFQNSEHNRQIIISSHSPFVLSDLAKENVIFLKNGEQVNVDINSFGANIHTLLSHGFFMEDGLMGEFAKHKIQNVINFINEKESDLKKDDILPIINLIGEPFLKQKLKEQFFVKYPKERNIDYEIDILEKKLDELKNAKNSK